MARAKTGSHQRKKKLLDVQRQHEHVKNQRKDFFDKRVYELVQNFDVIAIKDLKVKNMLQNRHLSKRILDAGWGYFKQRLLDKAADAGREVLLVDLQHIENLLEPCLRVSHAHRWVECECGLSLDRDHNAAINVFIRAGRVREPERSPSGQAWLRSPPLGVGSVTTPS